VSAASILGEPASTAPADRLVTLPRFPIGQIPTVGPHVVDWVEANLKQPNGPAAGQPFRYQSDQVNFLLWAYALDRDARWLFNHLVRRLAKGSGKSPFAATYALAEFIGPVRLERFDDRAPGGTIAKPVDMPLVQIAATAESQTTNTMRFVRAFCPKNGQLARDYEIDVGKTQFYRLPEGTLEVITASFTAAEGAQTTAAVGDETEHWVPTNQGPQLMATISDNLAKTGGRMMETANAWKPGIESVAEASWDDWVTQEEGGLQGDQRILYDARVAPPDTDMADGPSLRAALEHVYQFCPWVDIDTIIGRIWRKSAKADDSKRKYLNRPTVARDAWVTPEEWALMAHPEIVVKPGERIALFFDGSKSNDATALIGCRIDDGHVFTVGVWEPDPNDPDDVVDVAAVDAAVIRAHATWKVAGFFADVREWEQFAKIEWPNRYKADLEVWAAPAARPAEPVAWDMRGHTYEFAKAAEMVQQEIAERGFTHDGHAATGRHIANCRNNPYRDLVTVAKESPKSPLKIDAAVCVIGARMVRRLVLSSTVKGRPQGGVVVGIR
jgi:hypothetical protein